MLRLLGLAVVGRGLRKRRAVELADRGERQLLQLHEAARDHVVRQLLAEEGAQHGRVELPVRGDDVADQLLRRLALDAHRRRGHVGVQLEHRLDLLQLDPQPVQLHLRVDPAQELDLPLLRPDGQITGAVVAPPGPERILQEPLPGQLRLIQVPAREACPADHQLAGHSDRTHAAEAVQDVGVAARHRPADRRLALPHPPLAVVEDTADRRLRRAVAVHEPAPLPLPPIRHLTGARLTAGDDNPQLRQLSHLDRAQHRGRAADVGDPLARQQLSERGRVGARRLGHEDERGARRQRGEDLPDREVEDQRHVLRQPIARAEAELAAQPEDEGR